jgi:hypothetical protein
MMWRNLPEMGIIIGRRGRRAVCVLYLRSHRIIYTIAIYQPKRNRDRRAAGRKEGRRRDLPLPKSTCALLNDAETGDDDGGTARTTAAATFCRFPGFRAGVTGNSETAALALATTAARDFARRRLRRSVGPDEAFIEEGGGGGAETGTGGSSSCDVDVDDDTDVVVT